MDKKELLDWVIMDIGCRCKHLEDAKKNYNLKFLDPTPKLEKGIIAMREIFKILSKEPEEEPILDGVELRYLKNVIRPFKNEIKSIYKSISEYYEKEDLTIELKADIIRLPYFKKGTMYKNMEPNKEYTLEELGIHYDKQAN